jgi:hypothetical protein
MNMDDEQLKTAIAGSILREDQKRRLLERLAAAGATDEFWTELREALIFEIERRGGIVGDELERLSAETARLDEAMREKSEQALRAIEAKAASLSPTDFDAKKRLWDEHYSSQEDLQRDYEQAMKTMVSALIMRLTVS